MCKTEKCGPINLDIIEKVAFAPRSHRTCTLAPPTIGRAVHLLTMPSPPHVEKPLSTPLSGNLEDDWTFLDTTVDEIDRNQSQLPSSTKPNDTWSQTAEEHASCDAGEGCDEDVDGDLSSFVTSEVHHQGEEPALLLFHGEVDLPLPCTHAEVAKNRSAASAAARWRAKLRSSDVSFVSCRVTFLSCLMPRTCGKGNRNVHYTAKVHFECSQGPL